MLGHPSIPYHLEFTQETSHDTPGRAPTKENLLVWYVPDELEWKRAIERMEKAGFGSVKSYNPYWDANNKGKTYEDPDGWRIVIWNARWTPF